MFPLIHKDSGRKNKSDKVQYSKYHVTIPNTGETYAVTIAPKSTDIDDPVDVIEILLKQIFKHFKYCANIYLIPEFFKSGDIHFHGYLNVFDKLKYMRTLKSFTKKIGMIELRQLNDPEIWRAYLTKQSLIFKELLHESIFDQSLLWKDLITKESFVEYVVYQKIQKKQKMTVMAQMIADNIKNKYVSEYDSDDETAEPYDLKTPDEKNLGW